MIVRKNIAANYLGAGVAALASLLALPWYVSILGMKYWGLISFISILVGMLSLANAGLAQTLVREFSRLSAHQYNNKKLATILFGFERVYWVFALTAAILLCLFANTIVVHWIKLGDIPPEDGRAAVYGAAALFAIMFPVSVYRSVLLGCGEQVKLNVLLSCGAIIKPFGGVLFLHFFPSIYTYLIWTVAASLIETIITARMGWGILKVKRALVGWDSIEMRKLFSFTLSLTISVILGTLTMQVDKLVLSWMLPIDRLGYYAIASSVAMGFLQLFSPIASAVLPKIVQLHDQPAALKSLNYKVFTMLLTMVTLLMLVFLLAGKPLLGHWLKDLKVVEIIYPVIILLLVGTCMNAIYNVGYMNWLAAGATNKILRVNMLSLVLSVILTPIFVAKYDILGAACGWLVINGLGLVLSFDWLAKGKYAHAEVI
jgi:O-antigen/teichoic acid export membrane protein